MTVYASLPLTGPRAAQGADAADGARLALERAGGRAGGLEVRAKVLDDATASAERQRGEGGAWDPVATAANARAAAQDSTTVAYLGELDSEPTRTSLPITNDAGILQVSPGAGGVDLTAPAEGYPDSPDRYRPSGEPSFARVIPDDGAAAAAAAELAVELGLRAVRIQARDTPYERLTASEFERAGAGVGVEVVAAGGDAVLEIGPVSGLRLVPVAPGSAAEGSASVPPGAESHLVEQPLAPGNLADAGFSAEFAARFGRAPGPYAAYGFEAMRVALEGIEDAEGADGLRAAVVDAVLGSEHQDSILGRYSIDDDGDTTLCALQPYAVSAGRAPAAGKPICPR